MGAPFGHGVWMVGVTVGREKQWLAERGSTEHNNANGIASTPGMPPTGVHPSTLMRAASHSTIRGPSSLVAFSFSSSPSTNFCRLPSPITVYSLPLPRTKTFLLPVPNNPNQSKCPPRPLRRSPLSEERLPPARPRPKRRFVCNSESHHQHWVLYIIFLMRFFAFE